MGSVPRSQEPGDVAGVGAWRAGDELRWISNAQSDERLQEPELRSRVLAELGDVGIALLLLCQRVGVDFASVVREKLARNAERYPVAVVRGRAERPAH